MIKNIVLVLILSLSLSCTNDDGPRENQAFLDELIGRYKLRAAYLEQPIDLNGNGTAGTDLFQEVEYCNMSRQLESYNCTIVNNTIQSIIYDIPYSNHYNNFQNCSNCLRNQGVFRELHIDAKNESVTLVPNEFEENFILGFKAVLVDFRWENRVAYLTLEKEFYTPNGEWTEVILYMEYEWINNLI